MLAPGIRRRYSSSARLAQTSPNAITAPWAPCHFLCHLKDSGRDAGCLGLVSQLLLIALGLGLNILSPLMCCLLGEPVLQPEAFPISWRCSLTKASVRVSLDMRTLLSVRVQR